MRIRDPWKKPKKKFEEQACRSPINREEERNALCEAHTGPAKFYVSESTPVNARDKLYLCLPQFVNLNLLGNPVARRADKTHHSKKRVLEGHRELMPSLHQMVFIRLMQTSYREKPHGGRRHVWHFPSKHSLDSTWSCWSPDALHIVGESEDGTAIIVGHPIRTSHSHVYAVRYSSDGLPFGTSGQEVLHSVEAYHLLQQVHCIVRTSYDIILWAVLMELYRNKRVLATSGIDKNVYIWDLQALFRDINRARTVTVNVYSWSLATQWSSDAIPDINISGASPPVQDHSMSVAQRREVPYSELLAKSLRSLLLGV
ncbi:uncharacterized protein F5891DRAFT_980671 [Suillus fuscotomentosus]|uniref:Uncharacterized protein n=1 Tax=Suillus fuscotomentosus TaxID=1912939 RepID=A0AAD4E647_9AGAM|nr:uncharacterized protein F5891DRAFT_980671 [Suillus fuscotomentosus]KAG1900062.1 hypothetical protein F5891DRAFT_980671 [Suillus fuscotomentosus]